MTIDPMPLFDVLQWLIDFGKSVGLLICAEIWIQLLRAAEFGNALSAALNSAVGAVFLAVWIGVGVVCVIGLLVMSVVVICLARRDSCNA